MGTSHSSCAHFATPWRLPPAIFMGRCTFLHDPRLRESSDAWLNAGRDSPRFHLRDASASCWGSAGGDTSEGGGGGVRFNLDWSQTNARTSENGHVRPRVCDSVFAVLCTL